MHRGIAALLVLLGLGSACETVIGADFDSAEPRPVTQGDSGNDSGSSCDSARPPPPPLLSDSGGAFEISLVAKNVRFGEETTNKGTQPPGFGYDLDGLCANRGDPPPCLAPPPGNGDPTDGERGEDNAVCRMIGDQWSKLGLANPPLTTESANAKVQTGKYAPPILLHISDWVGGYDDERVTVQWLVPLAPDLAPGNPFVPKFDGTDVWPVVAKAGSQEPLRFEDSEAYVSGRVLVAHFPEGVVPLTTASFRVTNAVVTGALRLGDDGLWHVDGGIVAGITSVSEMLAQLPIFSQTLVGFPLCTDISTYSQQIKPWICSNADTLLPGSQPGSACNAMSFAIGFDAVSVALGTTSTPTVATPCSPATDPAHDSCGAAPDAG